MATHAQTEVRCTVRWVLLGSILVYTGLGIWPLAEWLTCERNRRDFCGELHNAGIAFSVECFVCSLFLMLTLCVLSRSDPRNLRPGSVYFYSGIVMPLAALCISFVAALANAVWVANYIFADEAGQLCKYESEIFFSGASLFVKVTLAILALELLVIAWVCSLLLCHSRQQLVWTSVANVDDIISSEEMDGDSTLKSSTQESP